MRLVLDSSVVAKLFFMEEGSDEAIRLMELGDKKDIGFLASELVIYEVGNVMVKNLGRKKKDGTTYMRLLFQLNIDLIPIDEEMACEALKHARENKITYYDGVHAALSRIKDAALVTQDRELLKKLKKALSIDSMIARIEDMK